MLLIIVKLIFCVFIAYYVLIVLSINEIIKNKEPKK